MIKNLIRRPINVYAPMRSQYSLRNTMDRNVKDQTVIVTGGAQGIGLSIVDKFLHNEAKVVIILDQNDQLGSHAANELNTKYGEDRAAFIKCDVTTDLEEIFNKIIVTYKTVDVLVNNAGIVKEDSIKDTLAVNLVSVIEWSMKFFDYARTDAGGKGGTIINVSSIYGYRCYSYCPFYTASKHGVLGFTKSKGHMNNFEKTAVRMLVICPGFVRTNMVKSKNKEIVEYLKQVAWQSPDAVGDAVVEIFRKADSGTAWLIEGGNPIEKLN